MCIMGNGNDPPARPPAYHPGNFLMKNMNPTNSGLMLNILLKVYLYIASYLTVISYTYIPKLYTNIIDSCSYRLIVNAKC